MGAALAVLVLISLDLAIGLGGGYAWAGRKLLLPGFRQGDPRAVLPPSSDYEIVRLRTKANTAIAGQFGPALGQPVGHARPPTVIFCYGMQQHLSAPANQQVFHALRSMAVNVFCLDYPGYGMSEGAPGEAQFYEAVATAFDYLVTRSDVDPRRIVATGRSLGTAMAIDLASRRPVAGLISVGGFTSSADVLAHVFPWMPRRLIRSITEECPFDSLVKMRSVACPVLLVYSMRDRMIPLSMADRLASATNAPITHLVLHHTRHNDLWTSSASGLDDRVRDWLHAR